MAEGTIIAVAGKGGVGKTSISAAIVRILARKYPDSRILAIDADPAVGLSTALGIQVVATIDDIRKKIISNVEKGEKKEAIELLGDARSRMFDAMEEREGFTFLAIGRPETAGCYCMINSYLKEVISVLSEQFDYVVIDGEAGIEQINRRVMEKVTHLLLVTDASKKGTQVIQAIKKVADELVMYKEAGVIVNRLRETGLGQYLELGGIPLLTCIGEDRELADLDMRGEDIFQMTEDSPLMTGVKNALSHIHIT